MAASRHTGSPRLALAGLVFASLDFQPAFFIFIKSGIDSGDLLFAPAKQLPLLLDTLVQTIEAALQIERYWLSGIFF